MTSFLEAVGSGVLVGDGAMGTMLMEKGLEPGACPDMWNLERPGEVTDVLARYRQAGADTLIANTFGANRWKLSGFGLEDRVAEISRAGVEVARKAAEGAFVLADIGPTGRFVAPLGTDPREAFVEVFAEQARALADAGADALILETFTSLEETLAALEAAKSTGLPVIASMTYSPSAAGVFRTIMGEDVARCATALAAGGADVVGANCSTGPQDFVPITAGIRSATDLPIIAQPNAGAPRLEGGKTVFPMTASEMAGYVGPILEAGAGIIGGCCGTTPEHIRAIRAAVDAAGSGR
ncbi:MAG: homocysteine S-methyltransferase family protein [Planctomycetota bacterium]|jgi:5-methyltetrahydrofolate--homocysteine methyltransferase